MRMPLNLICLTDKKIILFVQQTKRWTFYYHENALKFNLFNRQKDNFICSTDTRWTFYNHENARKFYNRSCKERLNSEFIYVWVLKLVRLLSATFLSSSVLLKKYLAGASSIPKWAIVTGVWDGFTRPAGGISLAAGSLLEQRSSSAKKFT